MTYRLLGAHVNTAVSGLPETIKQWKPPLIVLLDHSSVWHRVKEESPDTLMVGRLYQEQEPNFNIPALDPIAAAREHCDKILPWAERMGDTYSYWQGVNEPIVKSADAMKRYAEFEAERARTMRYEGFGVVVGSFSVGNPSDLSYWRDFLPALEAALHYDGALALHEYAWPTLDHEWPWYLLRHRKVYDGEPEHNWEGLPDHLKTLPLLITECGLDGLIERGDPPRGWTILYATKPADYLRQLAWYDAELQKDPYVVGAAIYCLATPDPKWKSYDIWPGLVTLLAKKATPIYRPAKIDHAQPRKQASIETTSTGPAVASNVTWQMQTEHRPGPRVILGTLPRPNIPVTVTDPWGNESTVLSGSKPGYGPGGWEVLAPSVGTHTIAFLDQRFEVQTQDRATVVTFTEHAIVVKPPGTGPSLPPDQDARWALVMGRLDRIVRRLKQRL